MDRQLVLITNGSTWGVALSEVTLLETLKIAEQLVEAINKGIDVFKSPELVTAEFAKREIQKALDAAAEVDEEPKPE